MDTRNKQMLRQKIKNKYGKKVIKWLTKKVHEVSH